MIQHLGGGRHQVSARNVWADDDETAAAETLAAARQLAQVLQERTETVSYPEIIPTPRSPHMGQQRIQMRDVLVDHADAELGAALDASLAHPVTLLGELRAMGGAIADVDEQATAWAGRHQEALVATWVQPAGLDAVDASFAPLQALGTGTYGAYSSDVRAEAAELAWPGETGRRLRSVADDVDPERLFDRGLVLPPVPDAGAA